MTIRLYDYFRSSACYRVRIALNLKGLVYEAIDTSLIDGAHLSPDYITKTRKVLCRCLRWANSG